MHKIHILFGARYWLVTPAQHLELLRARFAGVTPDLVEWSDRLDVNPIIPSRVPEAQRARIEWEEGGVRNVDRVRSDMIASYLACMPPEQE